MPSLQYWNTTREERSICSSYTMAAELATSNDKTPTFTHKLLE